MKVAEGAGTGAGAAWLILSVVIGAVNVCVNEPEGGSKLGRFFAGFAVWPAVIVRARRDRRWLKSH